MIFLVAFMSLQNCMRLRLCFNFGATGHKCEIGVRCKPVKYIPFEDNLRVIDSAPTHLCYVHGYITGIANQVLAVATGLMATILPAIRRGCRVRVAYSLARKR